MNPRQMDPSARVMVRVAGFFAGMTLLSLVINRHGDWSIVFGFGLMTIAALVLAAINQHRHRH